MSFGIDVYGISQYGLGKPAQPDIVTSELYVQPTSGTSGANVIVSSAGGQMVDNIRDSSFSVSIDPNMWLYGSTGSPIVTIINGINTRYVSNGSTSVTSTDTYNSCDVSIDYIIKSHVDSASDVVFAELRYAVASSTYISVRAVNTPMHGRMVTSSAYVDGAMVCASSIPFSGNDGTLRIIRHGSVIGACLNDMSMMTGAWTGLGSGLVSIRTMALDAITNVHTVISNFTSKTGLIMGDSIVTSIQSESYDKIVCKIPTSDADGQLDMVAFNHNGAVATRTGAFLYLPIRGAELSANDGMIATINNDKVIR